MRVIARPLPQRIEAMYVEPSHHAPVDHRRRRDGAKTEAVDRLEGDAAVGRGLAERDPETGLGTRRKRIPARRLARFRAAQLDDVPPRRGATEVMVEGDDAVDFRPRAVKRLGNEPLRRLVDVAELLLQRVQDRQQRAVEMQLFPDALLRHLGVPPVRASHVRTHQIPDITVICQLKHMAADTLFCS
jgi:hypothetical protein